MPLSTREVWFVLIFGSTVRRAEYRFFSCALFCAAQNVNHFYDWIYEGVYELAEKIVAHLVGWWAVDFLLEYRWTGVNGVVIIFASDWIQMLHMLAKSYHLPCVHFSCVIALLSAPIFRYIWIRLIAVGPSLYFAFQFFLKKLLKLIFYCNKHITLLAVMRPLFKCFFLCRGK